MPSTVIGALRVALGLDSAQFSTGADVAETRARRLGASISKSLRDPIGSATALKGAIAALAGTALVTTLTAMTRSGLEYASSLGEVSQQLGVTTKDLQEYRYAATQVGISQEEIDKGLAKLTVTMGQARDGVAKPKAAFKELSDLLGRDVLKSAATAGDAIPLIADALAKVSDPARRAALEVALFGKTGQRLDTLLAGGSAAVNQLRDAAQSLGIVLSDEQIQRADATADKLAEVKTVLEARIAGTVADNAEAIMTLADAFATVARNVGDAITAYSTWRNLRGYKAGDVSSGIALGQTKTGRVAMINDLSGQLADTNRQIAELGAPGGSRLRVNGRDDIETQRAALFARYQRLNRRRNAVIHLDRALDGAVARPRPGAGGTGAGTSDGDAGAASRKADQLRRQREHESEQAIQRQRRYEADLTRAETDELSAKSDLTASATRRAQIESDLLQRETTGQIEQVKTDKDLTDAQKRRLVAVLERTSALRQDLIDRRAAEDTAREALASAQARLGNEQDILQAQTGLARTARERARIELLILDSQFEALKLAQQAIIDDKGKNRTAAEIADARERLRTLGTLQGLARTKSAQDNAGPIQQYLSGIPRTADEVNEALEGVAANGLASIIDGLADVEGGFKGLANTVGSVANQIIASLLKIGLQKGIAALFGAIFPKAVSADGGDALTGGSGIRYGGARAKGGPVIGGRAYLVGEKGPEPFIPHTSGTILPADALAGGRWIIEPSPWFDVRAAGAAEPSIQSMGVRAAAGGSQMAQAGAARSARRRIVR